MKIANDKAVHIHYTLTNDAGEVLDTSDGGVPLAYLHGHENIIPGLEKVLLEKEAGDKLNAVIPPEEAYGLRNDELMQKVSIKDFPESKEVQPGVAMQIETNHGMHIAKVSSVDGDDVILDLNHELAGQTLTFDVEVVEVRDASKEELSHGHIHGPGGHDH